MSRLTRSRKSKKKLSRFQKLWNQATKLGLENERFRERLDKLVHRLHQEVLPVEREAAAEQIPLLKQLLVLGQRKSLARWERHELSEWIQELAEPLIDSGQIDRGMEDAISRYHAYNLGIQLNEDSDQSLAEQLDKYHEQQQVEETDTFAPESPEEISARIENEVNKELDRKMGRAPEIPDDTSTSFDLFEDELHAARQQAYDDYQQQRSELRARLMEERMAEEQYADDDESGGFDPFADDWEEGDFADPFASLAKHTTTISNEVFIRLFRATVAVLHPDREPNEEKQKRNHQLMAQLLSARKQGDVMTVIDMYQQYVSDEEGLTDRDEKQLIEMLVLQITNLKEEKEKYSFSSPLHRMAYEKFYFPSSKKSENVFREHIEYIRKSAGHSRDLTEKITSLKTLKPYLEMRNEEYEPEISLNELLDELMRYGPIR